MGQYHPQDALAYESTGHRVFHIGGESYLNFQTTYVRNQGAIWGLFSDMPDPWRTWVFDMIALIVLIVVIRMFRKSPPEDIFFRIALCFVLGGGLGNIGDRMNLKYVIDWLHFSWRVFGWEYSFPVFNIADVSINIGMIMLMIHPLISKKPV